MTVTAAAIFAGMLPIPFNGWGVCEGATMLRLSPLDVPREIARTTALLFGVAGVLCSLPGSVRGIGCGMRR